MCHKFQKIKKLYEHDFNPKYSNSESKNIDPLLTFEGFMIPSLENRNSI